MSSAEGKLPHAIVIGLDTLNGIQTVRILARHRIPIIAIAKDPTHHGCRTRLCERIIFTIGINVRQVQGQAKFDR